MCITERHVKFEAIKEASVHSAVDRMYDKLSWFSGFDGAVWYLSNLLLRSVIRYAPQIVCVVLLLNLCFWLWYLMTQTVLSFWEQHCERVKSNRTARLLHLAQQPSSHVAAETNDENNNNNMNELRRRRFLS